MGWCDEWQRETRPRQLAAHGARAEIIDGARPIGVTAARPRYRDGKAMLTALKPRLHRHGHQVPGQIGLVPNHLDGVDKNWSWQLSRGLRILCCNYRLSW